MMFMLAEKTRPRRKMAVKAQEKEALKGKVRMAVDLYARNWPRVATW